MYKKCTRVSNGRRVKISTEMREIPSDFRAVPTTAELSQKRTVSALLESNITLSHQRSRSLSPFKR